MRQVLFLSLIAVCGFFISGSVSAQDAEIEEVVVKGKVLQSDQVNALKTPTPIINVPQSLTIVTDDEMLENCLLYTSPSPRDPVSSRMPSSA